MEGQNEKKDQQDRDCQTEVQIDEDILNMIIGQQEVMEEIQENSQEIIENMMGIFYAFSRLRQSEFTEKVEQDYQSQIEKLEEKTKTYQEKLKQQTLNIVRLQNDLSQKQTKQQEGGDQHKLIAEQLRKEKLNLLQIQASLTRKNKDYEQKLIKLRSDYIMQEKNLSTSIQLMKNEIERLRAGQGQAQPQPVQAQRLVSNVMKSLSRGKDMLSDLNSHLQEKKRSQ